MEVCDVGREEARALLEQSGGIVKTAIVIHYLHVDRDAADRALDEAGGVIRRVLRRAPPPVRTA